MSRISSPVAEVEALRFDALPSRKKVDMAAAVRVDRTTVFLDAKGNVYSTQVKQRRYYTVGSGLEDTLTGCRLLGLLSKEAVAKHTEAMHLMRAKRERRYAAEALAENVKTLGIKLTAAQARVLTVAATA